MPGDYYQILGVLRNATEAQIKSAYHRLALRYHPDRNLGNRAAEEKFKEINLAYHILSDPEKRQTYDSPRPPRLGAGLRPGSPPFGARLVSLLWNLFETLLGEPGNQRATHRRHRRIRAAVFFGAAGLFALASPAGARVWVTDTDGDFSQGALQGVQVDGTGTAARLELAVSSTVDAANKYLSRDWQWPSIGDPCCKISMRFFVSSTSSVDANAVWLFTHTVGASTLTYRAGIQTNVSDAPTGGKPSGTYLSSGTFGLAGDQAGWDRYRWYKVQLPTVTLSAQTVYHLVIEQVSAAIGGNYTYFIVVTPMEMDVATGKKVPQTNSLWFDGANWSKPGWGTVFGLQLTDGSFIGNTMFYPYPNWDVYGGLERGEVFTWKDENISVNRVTAMFWTARLSPNPGDHLYATLRDITVDPPTVLVNNQILIEKTRAIAGWHTPFSMDLSTSVALVQGNRYRLSFTSPGSSWNDNIYYMALAHAGPWGPKTGCGEVGCSSNAQRDSAIQNSSFWGRDANAYSEGGNDYWSDAKFWFSNITYVSQGSFESGFLDAKRQTEVTRISWEPVSQPAGASLRLQIASSDDPNGPFNFVGPDASPNTHFTQAAGEVVNSASGKKYFKWKAFLGKSSSEQTPRLDKVSLEHLGRSVSGTEMQAMNAPNPFQAGMEKTAIRYLLPSNSKVRLRIFTPAGELVKEWEFSPGQEGGRGGPGGYDNEIFWDGRNGAGMVCASGVYIAQIEADPADGSEKKVERRKIAIVR